MHSLVRDIPRQFVRSQVYLSGLIDKLLPVKYREPGMRHFREEILPRYLSRGAVIYDVGGGSVPCIGPETKKRLGATLVGLDIDASELAKAPAGAYDEVIVADITKYQGNGKADLVVCHAVLEHVRDASAAFGALSSMLKADGRLVLVVPSRNAVFARINLRLSEKLKRRILFGIFPHKGLGHDGFPAFYDRCTPQEFRQLAAENGLDVELLTPYFFSSYFTFFAPLYLLWRIWIIAFVLFRGEQAAEVFSMVCRKT